MLWLFLLLVDKGQRFQIVIEDLAFLSASFRNASYR